MILHEQRLPRSLNWVVVSPGLLALLLMPGRWSGGQAFATWSIVAVDPKTKEVGVAGASCTKYVWGIAAVAPGKGALVVQAMSNDKARELGLNMLKDGSSPEEIIEAMSRPEFDPSNQQYGVVALGFEKESSAFTGDKCSEKKGHLTGPGVSVQGNILADQKILRAVLEAFESASEDPKLRLADRLLIAMEAGSALGGDSRCGEQTAVFCFLMVAKPTDPQGRLSLSIRIPGQKPGGPNPIKLLRDEYQQWDKYATRLEPFIEESLRKEKTPGLAIGIVEDGRPVYARGFGVTTLGDAGKPVTTGTLFHMASVTKTFVATAVMQLVERDKIDLDSPVTKYLPYFVLKDQRYRSITVRQMLTHTSGMPDVDGYHWDKPEFDDGALERYVRSLEDKALLWEPGSRWAYSNMAFEVLGDVVAKASGKSFEDYVEANILDPLGMKASTLLVKEADAADLTPGYTRDGDGTAHLAANYPYNRAHCPSSTLRSNVTDMARWMRANLNRGELDGRRILQDSTYEVMWKATKLHDEPLPLVIRGVGHIGISWFLVDHEGRQVALHNGQDDGYHATVRLVPARKLGITIMANSDRSPTAAIAEKALRVALGEE